LFSLQRPALPPWKRCVSTAMRGSGAFKGAAAYGGAEIRRLRALHGFAHCAAELGTFAGNVNGWAAF